MAADQAPLAKELSPKPPRPRGRLLVVSGAVTVVVLALALGLGLGLGLRKNGGSNPSASSPTGEPLPGGGSTTKLEDWRLDIRQYTLDMKWDISAPPVTRHFDLIISEGQGWPDGVVRDMLFINGKFPGPLIEANMGDRLVVNVTNQLTKNATAIHWHGIFQNGTNWYDGTTGITQCGIPPGKSFVYNFTVEQFGTYWYHSHYSTQYSDGIFGPLVIHAPEEANARNLYDHDQIVLVQDWYHDFSTVNLDTYLAPDNENSEPVPDNGLINGMAYFNCSLYGADSGRICYDNNTYSVLSLEADKRYRLRLINTGSFAEFEFSVDNHSLSVIEADGVLVHPQSVHRLPIHVAQRYSAVLTTNASHSTNYWLRAEMVTFCFTGTSPVLDPTTKAVISYSGNATILPSESSVDWSDPRLTICQDLDESKLVPAVEKSPPPATTLWRIDFSFGIGDHQLDRAKVNGTIWSPLINTTTLISAVDGLSGKANGNASAWAVDGQVSSFSADQFVVGVSAEAVEVVDILLYSLDEGSHPFHLHGHQFWILQKGSGPFDWGNYYTNIKPSDPRTVANALRRDTLTIEPYAWALIRFVADNPGLWALHCHITWHMEAGLLAQFMSRADVLRTMEVPRDVRALCSS
ncbi:multicopper like protein [Echria macrotheca]|uniref:Multicopper like protein n=1 Tax=Echria macrotheca TaxID=438768 RepID=A0AAJ0B8Z7_9PEZI|nr:multicopper like protein [Echria macrotheca]